MKILVLGGYGFIGSHIVNKLKKQNHTVAVVDCYHQYYTLPNWEYIPILVQRKNNAQADKEYIGQIEHLQFMQNYLGGSFTKPWAFELVICKNWKDQKYVNARKT